MSRLPFNFGVFRKTVIDWFLPTLATGLGLVAFTVIFVWAMSSMGTDLMEFVSRFPFLQKIIEASLGIRVDGQVTSNILFSVCFTHMITFLLAWSLLIAATTRATVGELEQGTADLLLTLPVNRSDVYLGNVLVWLMMISIVSMAPLPGIQVGAAWFETDGTVAISRFLPAALNFWCLNVAIAGLALLAGSFFERRSRAIAVVILVIFVSLVLNFAEPLVEELKVFRFVNLLACYRPVDVVTSGAWPLVHMSVLLLVGLIAGIAGLVIFCRKDIPAA